MLDIPHGTKKLYLAETKEKGRGVFSHDPIVTGETIEVCPVLFFSAQDAEKIDKTNLYNYYFSTEFLKNKNKYGGCFAMGTMSFCNHSDTPNAEIEKINTEAGCLFHLKALKTIKAGDEITITYGQVWFDPARD